LHLLRFKQPIPNLILSNSIRLATIGLTKSLALELGEDGIRYRRRGHWQWANWLLPGLLRDELRRREYDVVIEDINKIPFYAPLHTKLPVLAVIPHLFGTTVFREVSPPLATYVWAAELPIPIVYRHCRFMAISESTKQDLVRRGINAGSVEVIECGMDHEHYVLEDPPPRNAHPTLIHLGRLRRYKSVDVVLRAMAIIQNIFPNAELNIVGDGGDRPRLQTLARRMGLANTHFRGYLPRPEIVDLLYRTHLFLNPSPKEGWGLTVIEANECGVPVVASRRPGLIDSVRDGQTGRLARFGNPEDFAHKALEILTDPPLWRAYSENSVRWARSFSWEEAAGRTEDLLRRCLS